MPVLDPITIATTTSSGGGGSIWLPLALLIAAVIIGGLVVLALRKKFLGEQEPPRQAVGGLLDEMRRMHAAGELSDEEFDRVRKRLARKAAGVAESPTPQPRAEDSPDSGGSSAPPA